MAEAYCRRGLALIVSGGGCHRCDAGYDGGQLEADGPKQLEDLRFQRAKKGFRPLTSPNLGSKRLVKSQVDEHGEPTFRPWKQGGPRFCEAFGHRRRVGAGLWPRGGQRWCRRYGPEAVAVGVSRQELQLRGAQVLSIDAKAVWASSHLEPLVWATGLLQPFGSGRHLTSRPSWAPRVLGMGALWHRGQQNCGCGPCDKEPNGMWPWIDAKRWR